MELVLSNAVIALNGTCQRTIDQLWLLDHSTINREDKFSNSIFLPQVVQLDSDEFNFVFTPSRIDLRSKPGVADKAKLFSERLIAFFDEGNSFGVIAIGFNLAWRCKQDTDINDISRKLFFKLGNPFSSRFPNANSSFGLKAYRPFNSFGMTMDISPLTSQTLEGGVKYAFSVNYNFNCNMAKDFSVLDATNRLSEWSDCYQEALETTEAFLSMVR